MVLQPVLLVLLIMQHVVFLQLMVLVGGRLLLLLRVDRGLLAGLLPVVFPRLLVLVGGGLLLLIQWLTEGSC
jgi:hypothetical protein